MHYLGTKPIMLKKLKFMYNSVRDISTIQRLFRVVNVKFLNAKIQCNIAQNEIAFLLLTQIRFILRY
jgi:hypothetical protein